MTTSIYQPFGGWGTKVLIHNSLESAIAAIPGDDGSWMSTGSHQLRCCHCDLHREVGAILELAEHQEGGETKVQRCAIRTVLIPSSMKYIHGTPKCDPI